MEIKRESLVSDFPFSPKAFRFRPISLFETGDYFFMASIALIAARRPDVIAKDEAEPSHRRS